MLAESYVDPTTSTHMAGVSVLSNTNADAVLPELGEKEARASIESSMGTAKTVPSGPSSKILPTSEAFDMPPLLSDAPDFMSAGSWKRRYESTVTVPAKDPAGNLSEIPGRDTIEVSLRRMVASVASLGFTIAEHEVPRILRLQMQVAKVGWQTPLPLQLDAASQNTAHLLSAILV